MGYSSVLLLFFSLQSFLHSHLQYRSWGSAFPVTNTTGTRLDICWRIVWGGIGKHTEGSLLLHFKLLPKTLSSNSLHSLPQDVAALFFQPLGGSCGSQNSPSIVRLLWCCLAVLLPLCCSPGSQPASSLSHEVMALTVKLVPASAASPCHLAVSKQVSIKMVSFPM